MIKTTTWKHNFSNYDNLDHINANGHQHLEIFQPFASKKFDYNSTIYMAKCH